MQQHRHAGHHPQEAVPCALHTPPHAPAAARSAVSAAPTLQRRLCSATLASQHSCCRTQQCLITACSLLQEILGKHLLKQQGLTKSFLRLRVEALRPLPDSSLESFVRHLEARKLGESFEVDVRCC
jgi:hypothetical protein